MGKVITFGIQKGGTGKSTTAGIVAYLLAQDGYKVLALDMDSQGNLTDLICGLDPDEFLYDTILEAFKEENIKPYIRQVSDKLHYVPADDFLAGLPFVLYKKGGKYSLYLSKMLESVKDDYDFIVIDTPPALSEQMTNSVCASDYVCVVAASIKWAFTAVPRFIETIEYAQEHVNPNIKIVGILRTLSEIKIKDSKAFVEMLAEEYPDLVFKTVIKRNVATGRIPIYGLENNKEKKKALKQYKEFYIELKNRLGVK